MMGVNIKDQTTNEKIAEDKEVQGKEDSLIDELAGSDLLNDVTEEEAEEVKPEPEAEDEEEPEQDEAEETEDEEEDDEDDELIPKSKVDKRFAKLTAQIKALEAQNRSLQQKEEVNKDPEVVRLEKMSKDQLKGLIDDIEFEKIKAIKEEDDSSYKRLKALENKARDVLDSAPKKEAAKRQEAWANAVATIQADDDLVINDKAAQQIKQYATIIYQKYPSLQNSITGEAEALLMAAEHYKQLGKAPKDRSEEHALKRKVNKLKKKTALDGKTIKGDLQGQSLKKLHQNARKSSSDEGVKLDYFIKSGMVDPDSLI